MLDREFSALLGAPSSIRDEDITARLPSQVAETLDAKNMTIHVRLSQLKAQILSSEYRSDPLAFPMLIQLVQPYMERDPSCVGRLSVTRDLCFAAWLTYRKS